VPVIDLNADVGEGAAAPADERALLATVTSASVSCGAHAGSPEGVADTVAATLAAGVALGAHPSYPDREGFGRRPTTLSSAALAGSLSEQLAFVAGLATAHGGRLRYVKPHGALYHRAGSDPATARLLAAVVADAGVGVLLLAAGAGTAAVVEAAGVRVVGEAFADRAYASDGTLVPRQQEGGVLDDEGAVVDQALSMALSGRVRSVDGRSIEVAAASLCLHGDTPGALSLARSVRRALEAEGVTLAPFSP
jgi:UPF0271 protein